jgi:hypothetical protein
MISYAELSSAISQATQDSFSDRYRPSQRIASINAAVERATSALGWAMANNKGSEEALRELTNLRIFQTNSQGGINLNDPTLGHTIWNVLGVYARPELVTAGTISSVPNNVSLYRPDLAFSGTGSPVERITLEEVPVVRNSIVRNGNEVFAGNPKRVTFAYYIIGNASSSGYVSGSSELRVLPNSQTGRTFIAMSYIQQPTRMVDENSVVEFPQFMLRTLAEWTLSYLVIPQGDGTTMYSTAEKDAAQLLGFTIS